MHGLTRYLRAEVEVTDGVMAWQMPRTLLGVLPIGARRVAVPIAEVESIAVSRTVRPLRLAVGLAGVILPWFFLPWWAALPLLVLGLWVALVALGPQIEAVTTSGAKYRAEVCFGHQFDAELYMDVVRQLSREAREN